MNFHLSKKLSLDFNEALDKVTQVLKEEGFGIITTIDMKETFKKKLAADFRNYTILGACNPRYAFEALQEEDKVGVFLPCNIVVQEHDNHQVEISIVNPEEMMHNVDNLNVKNFATEIRESMQVVLDKL